MAASCGEVAWLDVSREHGMVLQEEDARTPGVARASSVIPCNVSLVIGVLTPHGREADSRLEIKRPGRVLG